MRDGGDIHSNQWSAKGCTLKILHITNAMGWRYAVKLCVACFEGFGACQGTWKVDQKDMLSVFDVKKRRSTMYSGSSLSI